MNGEQASIIESIIDNLTSRFKTISSLVMLLV